MEANSSPCLLCWIYSTLFNVHASIGWCDIYYLILSIFHVSISPVRLCLSVLSDLIFSTICTHRFTYIRRTALHMGRHFYESSVFDRKCVFDANKGLGSSAEHRIRIHTPRCAVLRWLFQKRIIYWKRIFDVEKWIRISSAHKSISMLPSSPSPFSTDSVCI